MTIHIFEPGGSGGVFQHALALAQAYRDAGHSVTFHTASDPEIRDPGLDMCCCVDWHRPVKRRRLRQARILTTYLAVTLPHLSRSVRPADVLHVQGRFKPGLLTLSLLVGRARRARLVLSPHNTFARSGRLAERIGLTVDVRLADRVVVFSEADRVRLASRGLRAIVAPLSLPVPSVSDRLVADWRAAWGVSDGLPQIVLFAGQLRSDKRLDLVIDAVACAPPDRWVLAVVGADLGVASDAMAQAAEVGLDVRWSVGWTDLSLFTAAIAAADVVVCPYDVASQSGVLDIAQQVGTRSVARDVGGLGELATVTFQEDRPDLIMDAISNAMRESAGTNDHPQSICRGNDLVLSHRDAYGL